MQLEWSFWKCSNRASIFPSSISTHRNTLKIDCGHSRDRTPHTYNSRDLDATSLCLTRHTNTTRNQARTKNSWTNVQRVEYRQRVWNLMISEVLFLLGKSAVDMMWMELFECWLFTTSRNLICQRQMDGIGGILPVLAKHRGDFEHESSSWFQPWKCADSTLSDVINWAPLFQAFHNSFSTDMSSKSS